MTTNPQTGESLGSTRPGWPELITALLVYVLGVLLIGFWIVLTPTSDGEAGPRGIAAMAANGLAGTVAFFAAWALRIRDFRAFGFRPVERKWLLVGVGLGLFAFALSFLIEAVYFSLVTEPNTQADFQDAAKGGLLSLIAIVVSGALFTPIGEELVFRGVVANALNKYGAFAGIFISAAIFGIAHGPSVILVLAFMVGVLTGWLFRKTESLWPCLVVHIIYNGLHLLYYSTL